MFYKERVKVFCFGKVIRKKRFTGDGKSAFFLPVPLGYLYAKI